MAEAELVVVEEHQAELLEAWAAAAGQVAIVQAAIQ